MDDRVLQNNTGKKLKEWMDEWMNNRWAGWCTERGGPDRGNKGLTSCHHPSSPELPWPGFRLTDPKRCADRQETTREQREHPRDKDPVAVAVAFGASWVSVNIFFGNVSIQRQKTWRSVV